MQRILQYNLILDTIRKADFNNRPNFKYIQTIQSGLWGSVKFNASNLLSLR
jgi:hypothetical protein